MFVGWALRSVLANAPDNDEVVNICAQFAQFAMADDGKDAQVSESDKEQIAALAELTRSWKNLHALAPVLHPKYWTAEGWQSLGEVLHVGGHRGKAASWRLARVKLVIDALDEDESSHTIYEPQGGLAFLRSAIIDGIASGDGILANHAVYGLSALARKTQTHVDDAAVAAALRAAADDVRIGVAHGAAFVAHYLLAYGAAQVVDPQVLAAAEAVRHQLSDDPMAVVRRQADKEHCVDRRPRGRFG